MSYANFIRDLAVTLATIRDKSAGSGQLLDDQAATNLGNEFDIPPAEDGSSGQAAFGNPVRMLNVLSKNLKNEDPRPLTITIQQDATIVSGAGPSQGSVLIPGPIVGIIEFGAGSGRASFEFDIPAPVAGPGTTFTAIPPNLMNNGVVLTLPGSSFRVFARNDANLRFLLNAATGPRIGVTSAPAKVRTHCAYGSGNLKTRLQRTYYLAGGIAGASPPDLPLPPGGAVRVGIPPFSQRVRFIRSSNVPMSVIFETAQASLFATFLYVVPVGDDNFSLEVKPQFTNMVVTNASLTGNSISGLSAVFEIMVPWAI